MVLVFLTAPVNPKTALKSKIVAEFVPQDFVDCLLSHKLALEECDLKEKQLSTLSLDLSSSEALKRLKDKAGGSQFSKDFEEGSAKLQEFVSFLEAQKKTAPLLIDVLGNADIFYHIQYKEVKIVANAYRAFGARITSLKRKLDALKASLDDSPIPSPSENAPSPMESESPPASKKDNCNRGGEDLELVEEQKTKDDDEEESSLQSVSKMANSTANKSPQITSISTKPFLNLKMAFGSSPNQNSLAKLTPAPLIAPVVAPSFPPSSTPVVGPLTSSTPEITPSSAPAVAPSSLSATPKVLSPTPDPPVAPTTTPAPVVAPSPLQMNLASVDLGKISSILSSLSSAMKNTSVSPSPNTPNTPSTPASASKTTPSTPSSNPLANILAKVDLSPESILSVLSKSQAHGNKGLSSLLSSARAGSLSSSVPGPSSSTSSASVTTNTLTKTTSSLKSTKPTTANNIKPESIQAKARNVEKLKEKEKEKKMIETKQASKTVVMPSLESKINSFLQGNPGFGGLDLESNSPLIVEGENLVGTPVRDESGSTPTQDEFMDSPQNFSNPKSGDLLGVQSLSPTAYHSEPWDAVITPGDDLVDNVNLKDRDYRKLTPVKFTGVKPVKVLSNVTGFTQSATNSVKTPTLGAFPSNSTKPTKALTRTKDDENLKRKTPGVNVQSAGIDPKPKSKVEGDLKCTSSSKGNTGSERDGTMENKGSGCDLEQYHRIETLVSLKSSNKGASVESNEYGNRIQTVEGIRLMGRSLRRGSSSVSRSWYEDEEFQERRSPLHPDQHIQDSSGTLPPPPPIPSHLPPSLQYTHSPYSNEDPSCPSQPITPQVHHSFYPPSILQIPPPLPQMPPPLRNFQISQTPPPHRDFPITQGPPSPLDFPTPTSSSIIGLPFPPSSLNPDAPLSGNKPQNPSLFGEMPRPGTVKEQFTILHAPPLHRPGTPGVPPPLLGRVREPPNATLPSPNTPPPSSPIGETPLPLLPLPSHPPITPPNSRPHQLSSPKSILNSTNQHHLPPSPNFPRSLLPLPFPSQSREPFLTGTKRPSGSFGGMPFNPPKRPFLPPRY
ncbi:hypothetical protein DNTS_029612 [Danionella cerebrum]|uniref:Uncharacterized protein n=1 Tax=Danionella cerebrum TaxID=2873325 RepID=A0A553N5N7_9TELE|nr:hypothetical protein DNTS_029612 [Danionella translucida]